MIRKLLSTDYSGFLNLIQQFRPTQFTKEEFISQLTFMNEYSEIWVIVDEDQHIIASATIFFEHKFVFNQSVVGHIEDVIVRENYRGGGIGSKLIQHLIQRATEYGCYKVILNCDPDIATFYEQNGFMKRGCHMSRLI